MSDEGSLEKELKFQVSDLDGLRERLTELEAERLSAASFENNWVFDRDGEMEQSGRTLRLRQDRHGARVGYKGPARFEGRAKVRQERETRVESFEEMLAILEALGYRVVRRYQKLREEWRLGGVQIALDHTPIGDFAEFEGEGAEKVSVRCGFDPEKSERRTYLRLYSDYLKDHPEAPPDMVFR